MSSLCQKMSLGLRALCKFCDPFPLRVMLCSCKI